MVEQVCNCSTQEAEGSVRKERERDGKRKKGEKRKTRSRFCF